MTTSIHQNCDEEDLDLIRRTCSGSLSSLLQVLDKHRSFLYYLYLNWYGIEAVATESLESLQFRITVRLRYRLPHIPVRLWLYQLAVEHLLDSEITLPEQFVHYPLQWRQPLSPNTPDKSRCNLLRFAPFDCRTGVLLSLNRRYRTPFILDSMLRIKPVIGARVLNISLPLYRQRCQKALENALLPIRIRSTRQFSICPCCFQTANASVDQEVRGIASQDVTELLLPTIADWVLPYDVAAFHRPAAWFRRWFIYPAPEIPAVIKLIRGTVRSGRAGLLE
jgi:hypothetical protein